MSSNTHGSHPTPFIMKLPFKAPAYRQETPWLSAARKLRTNSRFGMTWGAIRGVGRDPKHSRTLPAQCREHVVRIQSSPPAGRSMMLSKKGSILAVGESLGPGLEDVYCIGTALRTGRVLGHPLAETAAVRRSSIPLVCLMTCMSRCCIQKRNLDR